MKFEGYEIDYVKSLGKERVEKELSELELQAKSIEHRLVILRREQQEWEGYFRITFEKLKDEQERHQANVALYAEALKALGMEDQ